LQIYQSTALKRLSGLGLLERDALRDHYARLETGMVPGEIMKQATAKNEKAYPLMRFLINDVGSLPLVGRNGLVQRAGLPLRGPVI